MHKSLTKITALLCVAALLIIFTACSKGEKPSENNGEPVYHTITFDTNGGTPIADMEVQHGHHADQPENPVLENYIFCHWELSDGRTWFFDSKSVTKDISLEAIWIKAEDLFGLAPMPDGNGLMITEIKSQEEFSSLKIPSIINGKTIEGIGDEAFRSIHDRYAQKIIFPDTIRYIGEEALATTENVSVVFSGKISYLGEGAFMKNSGLAKISLAKGLEKIPYRAFMGCTSLKTLDIPEGVAVIEENALDGCKGLLTVVIPSSLTTVESGAFDDCPALKSVFFKGTEKQYDNIDIDSENQALENAKVYFYSEEEPTEDGAFWHYGKNNTPVIW